MKFRYLAFFSVIILALASCQKNAVSGIPSITFEYCGLSNGADTLAVNQDTPFLKFSIIDGDADLGNTPPGPPYDIYINDMRFDTGYAGFMFPSIDQSIEDPKKGIQGTCIFLFLPSILQPRGDSIHTFVADTVYYKVYILDRAGHHSDTITTTPLIIYPK